MRYINGLNWTHEAFRTNFKFARDRAAGKNLKEAIRQI